MICSKCGKELDETAKFCDSCGAKVVVENEDKTKNGKGGFLKGFLCGALALAIFISAASVTGFVSFGKGTGKSGRIEGKGFAAPEDAVAEYINALRTKDLDKMISCFAVETFVENYDFEDAMERYFAFMPLGNGTMWPDIGELSQDMNVKRREAWIMSDIIAQYNALVAPSVFDTPAMNYTSFSDYDDFIDTIVLPDGENVFSEISFDGKFLSWGRAAYFGSAVSEDDYIEVRMPLYGADDVKPVFAELEIDGAEYILAMDAAEYDGVWYLCDISKAIQSPWSCGIAEK